MKQPVLGVIVGNRGFFPGHLSEKGRQTVLELLERESIKAIALGPSDSPYGSVESIADSQKLAD
ncbi:MAG: fucose isomerase, partial [Nitrososphaerales archaeon]